MEFVVVIALCVAVFVVVLLLDSAARFDVRQCQRERP